MVEVRKLALAAVPPVKPHEALLSSFSRVVAPRLSVPEAVRTCAPPDESAKVLEVSDNRQ